MHIHIDLGGRQFQKQQHHWIYARRDDISIRLGERVLYQAIADEASVDEHENRIAVQLLDFGLGDETVQVHFAEEFWLVGNCFFAAGCFAGGTAKPGTCCAAAARSAPSNCRHARNLFRAATAPLRVEKWPLAVASPEVAKNNYARNRRVCAPERGEGVTLDLHHHQKNCQVGRAEDDHRLDLREK